MIAAETRALLNCLDQVDRVRAECGDEVADRYMPRMNHNVDVDAIMRQSIRAKIQFGMKLTKYEIKQAKRLSIAI